MLTNTTITTELIIIQMSMHCLQKVKVGWPDDPQSGPGSSGSYLQTKLFGCDPCSLENSVDIINFGSDECTEISLV